MDGRTWLFDNSLLALNVFDGLSPLHKIRFDSEPFWIRFHNMPVACMNKECGEQIGGSLGKIVEMDLPEDGIGWGPYLRAKIDISRTNPLARGRTICVHGERVWIPIKYEKLPRICFDYGFIAHGPEGCPF